MSIFINANTIANAHRNLNRITIITETGIEINAVLKEPIQYSVEATWDNIFNFNDRFESTQRVLSFLNVGFLNAGIWSKRFYKGGSYIKINPKIRIVDSGTGAGGPLYYARLLMDLALIQFDKTADEQQNEVINKIKNLSREDWKKIKKVIKNGIDSIFGDDKQREISQNETVSAIHEMFNIFKSNTISNSPSPVRVKISNFYENKFIVESVNVEFSKEMTEDGPLYVDIEMVMSGIEIATKGRTGLLDNRYSANSSRIKITD